MMIRKIELLALIIVFSHAYPSGPINADLVDYPSLQGFTYLDVQGGPPSDDASRSVIHYEYPSGDLIVRCVVVFPDAGQIKYPTLVLCHGGINGIMNRMRSKAVELAGDGYLVVMPTYRGEDGSEGEIEVAAGEVDDVLACIDLLRDCEQVDPNRIALIGSSHGALIAALAASRDPEILAVVCAYGVMDIVGWWYYLQDSGRYEEDDLSRKIYGGGPLDHREEFAIRSAVGVAGEIEQPVLIIQGDCDTLVPPGQAEALVKAFRYFKKSNYIYNLYPDVGHGFLWWNDGDLNRRGEHGIETAHRAWDDSLAFILSCWEGRLITETQ